VVHLALRDRLGESGTQALTEYVERNGEMWRDDVVSTCLDRTDARFHEYTRRIDDMVTRIVHQLGDMRVELLRWSFAFWLGQVLVMAALLKLMLQ
jgi:hypothetical protein